MFLSRFNFVGPKFSSDVSTLSTQRTAFSFLVTDRNM